MAQDDLFFVPQPFVPKQQQPDFRREFYQELPDMRTTVDKPVPATMMVCAYDHGVHEMPPKPWCPHFEHEDETGKRVRNDWTVQWDKLPEEYYDA